MTAVPKTKLTTPRKRYRNWRTPFLETLAKEGYVCDACEAAGVSRWGAYKARHAEPDFAREWDEALQVSAETLENIAYKRAAARSDLLLIFLLKGKMPEVYRESRPDQQPTINVSVLDPTVAKAALMAATEAEKGSG